MAEDTDQDQKTEAPSGKRLDEAREHGQVPVSREAATWVSMLGSLVVIGWIVPPMMGRMGEFLHGLIEGVPNWTLDENNIQALFYQIAGQVGMICGIAFLLLMAAAIGGVMMQTGFFFALDLMTPDFARLAPSRGLKRLFSTHSLMDLAKGMGKLLFLGFIAFSVLMPVALESPGFTGMAFDGILMFLHKQMLHLLEMLLLAFTAIAAADLFFVRWQYIRNLRMTKVEVKDERKQQEGDPMIKSRLRQLRVEKARKRMMSQVPKADVVITNPTHYAIALQYNSSKMAAPIVLAKGINLIAERIRDLAEEHHIPLVSNPPLARALHDTVEVDQQIPTQHYRAVAEIISYVYKLKKRKF